MTLYDSSVLIDYLDGVDEAVEGVTRNAGERAVAPLLVLFEVYQGEVYRSAGTDLNAVDGALEWLTVVDGSARFARGAAELQDELRRRGTPLAARDAFVAGTARGLGESLAVSDSDFDVAGLREVVDLTVVGV
jgi:predicted nucleic acid-binding protein